MTTMDLSQQLKVYDQLFAAARYVEAAQLAETVIWPLFIDGCETEWRRVLMNTLHTAARISLWMTLGDIFYKRDEHDKARSCYQQALQQSRNHESDQVVQLLYSVGNTHFLEGDYPRAEAYYEESLALSRKIGFVHGEAESLIQLSETHRAHGYFNRADEAGRLSLAINVRERRKNAIARAVKALRNVALYFDGSGDKRKATEILVFCLRTLRDHPDNGPIQEVYRTASELNLTHLLSATEENG